MLAAKTPLIDAPLTPAQAPQTFANEGDRQRLSGAALKAFKRVAIEWKLTNVQSAALLGVSGSTWDRIKRGARDETLSQDQLTRASAIVGLYKGLRLLFADDMSSRWPLLPNRGPIFAGTSPVETMINGGIPVMLEVRRYIDAVRGGI
jgi:hypothetical protein